MVKAPVVWFETIQKPLTGKTTLMFAVIAPVRTMMPQPHWACVRVTLAPPATLTVAMPNSALSTQAVLAIFVELSPAGCVGAVGDPVKAGLLSGA